MMPSHNRSYRVAYISILTAVSAILGYIESLFPIVYIGIPGAKLGLANIVSLLAIYTMGPLVAVLIIITRILLVGIMFGNAFSIIYSLFGGITSIIVMLILKRLRVFGIVGISAAGGAFHNIGQLIIAIIVMDDFKLIYYLPALMIVGTICGILMGILGYYVFAYTKHSSILNKEIK